MDSGFEDRFVDRLMQALARMAERNPQPTTPPQDVAGPARPSLH